MQLWLGCIFPVFYTEYFVITYLWLAYLFIWLLSDVTIWFLLLLTSTCWSLSSGQRFQSVFIFIFILVQQKRSQKIKEQVFLDWSRISTSKRSNSCFGIVREDRSVLQTGWLPNVATYDTSKSPFADGSASRPSNHLLMLELRMEVETLGNLPAYVQWPCFISHICCRSVKRGCTGQKVQDLLWQSDCCHWWLLIHEDLVLRPWSITMKKRSL